MEEKFMIDAYKMAEKAYKKDEVPIGAVVVKNNKIIARGYNKRENKQNALLHAEIVAINKACKKLHSWRLDDCDIYVTLEPCPMCAGAILNARINNMYFGAKSYQDKEGICEKILSDNIRLNHKTNYIYLKNNNCENIIKLFFKNIRKINNK